MQAHLEQTPPALADLRPEIPEALSSAIAKAMAKDPPSRFHSAREFMVALQSNDAAIATITSTLPTASIDPRTPGASRRESGDASRPVSPSGRISSSTEPLPEALEQVRKHLAEFIGPIAKVVVRRLAPQCADLEQLYREAAKEIATESDRQRFLRLRTSRR